MTSLASFVDSTSLRFGNIVSVVISLQAGWPRNFCLIPGKGKYFYFLHNFQTGCGIHQASCLMGNVVLSPGLRWPGDDLSFQPWVRKGRAKPLFPPYAFMACTPSFTFI